MAPPDVPWTVVHQLHFEERLMHLTASVGLPLSWVENLEWLLFCTEFTKLYTPPPFLVDSWSIPSIPVHSQESLGSPGSFPPHSQFIPGPFPEQGGVDMGGGKRGGESV
jgi:hypothetical protein